MPLNRASLPEQVPVDTGYRGREPTGNFMVQAIQRMSPEARERLKTRAADIISMFAPTLVPKASWRQAGLTPEELAEWRKTNKGMVHPKLAGQAVQNALDLVIPLQPVYHGTPHKWPAEPGFPKGRPRLDKIGTGEGAAAYGWGWYSAEAEDVAKSYVPKNSFEYATSQLQFGDKSRTVNGWVAKTLKKNPAKIDDVISEYEKKVSNSLKKAEQDDIYLEYAEEEKNTLEFLRDAKKHGEFTIVEPGSLYALDIPDEVLPKLLDWDKPLSEQMKVRGKIEQAFKKFGFDDNQIKSMFGRDITGEQAYVYLASAAHGKKEASEYLASIGIPGNKYLDQGSRASGKGTYNYVIWDQDVLDRVTHLPKGKE